MNESFRRKFRTCDEQTANVLYYLLICYVKVGTLIAMYSNRPSAQFLHYFSLGFPKVLVSYFLDQSAYGKYPFKVFSSEIC